MLNIFKKNKAEQDLSCEYCNGIFPDRAHLDKHKKVAHAKGR